MIFGRKAATVETPTVTASQPAPDAVATPAPLQLVPTDVRELQRGLAQLLDDMKWMDERFNKLQLRVTAELREMRRLVDELYDAEEEDDEPTRR